MTLDKYSVLKQLYGYDSFREGQERIIDDILSGRDCFAVMPTGAGKSVCYQIPAILLPGITIVISPLISLMKDQVMALKQIGVPAAYLNSSLTPRQFDLALENAIRGMYRIIYVAPERLVTPRFNELSNFSEISLVAVDEAHCVSQWGQDFRPSYLNIPEYIERLPNRPRIAAFTATATSDVREDVIKYLRLDNPDIMISGFDRPNLFFSVEQPPKKYDALLSYLKTRGDDHGIVYCSTRKTVDEVSVKLNNDGIAAAGYHAGLTDEERRKAQDDFTYDRVQVIVATNAFGMGIDKSDVRFVVHYNMPKDLESYYQEAGRAGRDGAEADCVLYYSGQDTRIARFLIENSDSESSLDPETAAKVRERDLMRLEKMVGYCRTPECLRAYILRYFGEKGCSGNCGRCSNCVSSEGSPAAVDVTAESGIVISFVKAHSERYGFSVGPKNIASALKGRDTDDVIRLGLASNPYFGALDALSLDQIRNIIDMLVSDGYLKYSEGKYRTIVPGENTPVRSGRMLIKGEIIKKKSKTGSGISKNRTTDDDGMASDDSELFTRLKALRKKLADARSVPPYVIFSDKTLIEFVKKRPASRSQLLECSGVGEKKCDLYGDMFLREIGK